MDAAGLGGNVWMHRPMMTASQLEIGGNAGRTDANGRRRNAPGGGITSFQ